jgi:small subunit ribosomal protein S6
MVNYETLMLVRTEITDDELNALERQLDKLIDDHKGKMMLFDRWGKYKLAYPVQKNVYGIYILVRYQAPKESLGALFKELDTLFKIKYNELVMRHVAKKLDQEASSVYKRPEAIGAHGGTSNLDSFIKENKMKGLIDTPVEKKAEEEVKSEGEVEEAAVPEEEGA